MTFLNTPSPNLSENKRADILPSVTVKAKMYDAAVAPALDFEIDEKNKPAVIKQVDVDASSQIIGNKFPPLPSCKKCKLKITGILHAIIKIM